MVSRRRIRFLLLGVFALTAAVGAPHKASAQVREETNVAPRIQEGQQPQQIEERRQRLFNLMLANPADLDTAFEYAALSSQAGDLEAAISTLERMLIFAPDVPRLQLELGVLYFRLGSYEVARNYFNSVLSAPNVPDPVKLRVDRYLSAIKTQTAVNRFDGAVLFGTRYQSNANGGAIDRIIDLNGRDFILNDAAMADADTNAFVSGNFHYSHDFSSQGDRFDVDLSTYGALYAHHHEINIALADVRFGPVFNLDRIHLDDTEFGVYGILGGIVLQGDPYWLGGGAGVKLSKRFSPQTRAEVRFEYQYQDYRNSTLRPTADDRTGDKYLVGGVLLHQLTDRVSVFGFLNGERTEARREYESNRQIEAGLGMNYSFAAPLTFKNAPSLWTVGLAAGLGRRLYDEPDPAINAGQAQRDVESFVRGTLTIPLAETWSVQTTVGYQNVSSNYDIDSFDNISTSIGFMKRF